MVDKAIVLAVTLTSLWLIVVCSLDMHIRLFQAGDRTLGRGDYFLSIVAFNRTLSCRYRTRTPWSPTPNLDLEGLFANRLPTMQKIWQFDRYGVQILRYSMKVGFCQKFSDERVFPFEPEAIETDLSIKTVEALGSHGCLSLVGLDTGSVSPLMKAAEEIVHEMRV